MSEITKTWDLAQVSFSRADFLALIKAGVQPSDITSWMASNLLGADDIKITDGRWVRQFRGERAIILPLMAPESGELIDLVAFRPDLPLSCWMFTGGAPMLGYDELFRAELHGDPLFVHRSPLEWLKAGAEGVVILDWLHYWPAYLSGISVLRTETVDFGRRLSKMLNNPFPLPEIQVASS